jgi:hypothetical protein
MKYAISYYLITVYDKLLNLITFAALLKSMPVTFLGLMMMIGDDTYLNTVMDKAGFLLYAFAIEVLLIVLLPSKVDLLTMLGLRVFEKPIGQIPEVVERLIKKQLNG